MARNDEMTALDGGTYSMGSDAFYADEGPVHTEQVEPFLIDTHQVTNETFAAFVDATGYVTVAERALEPADYPGVDPADLAPGGLVFVPTTRPVDLGDWRNWWHWVPGSDWRHPFGPGSSIDGREQHPVVQVSFEDAATFAAWAGKRLPTEAEWEYAARGGGDPSWPYAWGPEPRVDNQLMANSWQGRFPYLNTGADGWVGTSPVGTFPANGFGLFDMIGNVWEWTTTYYSARHDVPASRMLPLVTGDGHHNDAHGDEHAHPHAHGDEQACGAPEGECMCGPSDNGRKDDARQAAASAEPGSTIPRRALKGGSHLCAPEYCLRYRPAARSPQSDDSAATHIGFRCVRSL